MFTLDLYEPGRIESDPSDVCKTSWKTAGNWAVKPRLSSENRVGLLLDYSNLGRNFDVLYKLSLSAAHRFAHNFQTLLTSRLRAISDTARLQHGWKVVQPQLLKDHLEAAAQLVRIKVFITAKRSSGLA